MTAPVLDKVWIDVDMRHVILSRRDNDWWAAFLARTPNRTLHSGRIRVPCDSHGSAEQTVELLAGFGIPRTALRIGDMP